MEANLVHGEGDLEGQPFRLAAHELRAIYRWYEHNPITGDYLHRKGLIGWPKGSGKTELVAGLGLEHLSGPAPTKGTPVVTVAAVDGDQADELVRVAGMMIDEQPVGEDLDVVAGRITQRRGGGSMKATSSALGKNDGKKTSLLLCDEIHEWDAHSEAGAKRHGVLERSTNKRRDGRQLNITTAGWSLDTLAGAMFTYGEQVALGQIVDPGFLMEWWQASEHWDLDDPAQLVAAIREANPAADPWNQLDNLVRSYHEHRLRGAVEEYVRYHLNRWPTGVADAWLDPVLWASRLQPGTPPAGTRVVLGFDGSHTGDSTALVGVTVAAKPHVFKIACWEREPDDRDWRVPIDAVEAAIAAACDPKTGGYDVVELAADLFGWISSLARLEQRGVNVVEIPQNGKRMGAACQRFYEAVQRDLLTHDGDKQLTKHIGNARRRETDFGIRIVKEHERSRRHIDLAIAAVMAFDRASWLWEHEAAVKPRVINLAEALAADNYAQLAAGGVSA